MLFNFVLFNKMLNQKKKTKSIFETSEFDVSTMKTIKSPMTIYEFDKKKDLIQEGFSGRIYMGIDKKSKNIVALKVFDLKSDYLNEVNCYDKIQKINKVCNKNILCVIEHFESLDENYQYVIVLPYLDNYLTLDRAVLKMNKKQINYVLDELVHLIDELNKNGIYHSDIHESNILVRLSPFDLKLIDFGNCNTKQEVSDIERLQKIIKFIESK